MNPADKSDWKHLNASLPEWRERYLERTNHQIVALLTMPDQTPTERFWAAHDRMREESRLLRDCFDGLSKSRMAQRLVQMQHLGIITDEDIGGFSEDLRATLRRWTAPEASGENQK